MNAAAPRVRLGESPRVHAKDPRYPGFTACGVSYLESRSFEPTAEPVTCYGCQKATNPEPPRPRAA